MAGKKSKAVTTIVVLLVVLVVLLSIKLMMTSGMLSGDINLANNGDNMNTNMNNTNNNIKQDGDRQEANNNVDNSTDNSVVSQGDVITVDYIGKHTNGVVFDTSIESVAKESGVYQTGRNYKNGLTFKVGAGQMIAGFDRAVIGMKIGEQKTITLEPKDAYGEWTEKNVQTVSLDQLPPKADNSSYEKGDVLQSKYGPVTVVGVEGTGVQIDFNNPMAGKTLIFDLSIKDIQKK